MTKDIPDYKYGVKIQQKLHHIPVKKLDSLRFESDFQADLVLDALIQNNISVDDYLQKVLIDYNNNNNFKFRNGDLISFAKDITTYPSWLDFNLLKEGQVVYYKYSGASSMGLLYYSLVGGFSAPKIVAVLDKTAYLTKGHY